MFRLKTLLAISSSQAGTPFPSGGNQPGLMPSGAPHPSILSYKLLRFGEKFHIGCSPTSIRMYVTYACTYSVSRIVAKGCDIGYSKYGPKVKKHYRLHSEHTNLLIPRLEDAGSRMLPNNPKVCIITPQSVRRSKRNWVASNLFCNHPSLSQST